MQTVSEALAEYAQREGDLASYYEFHCLLLEFQEKIRKGITATLEPLEGNVLQERLLRGLPQLSFDRLPIEADRFAVLATSIGEILTDYNPEWKGQALPADASRWSSLAERRFMVMQGKPKYTAIPSQEALLPLSLAEIAADIVLKPYLVWAAEGVLPHLDQGQWRWGYCPVCGGRPDFAFLSRESGARYLLCARCNSQWLYRRIGCPFCGNDDYTGIFYYSNDDGLYRLYLCKRCRRYLKTMDLRKTNRREVLVEVERIITVAMNAAAQQEGYR